MSSLAELLARDSYVLGKNMKLSSGNTSNVIIDCSLSLRTTEGFEWLKEEIPIEIRHDLYFTCVAGPSSGADPVCAALLEVVDREISWLSIRKQPKEHGFDTGRITGKFKPGQTVLVVDDVLTTGNSLIDTIKVCQEAKLKVVGGLVVVDREEFNGKELVTDYLPLISFWAITTKKEIESKL